jgi:membrane associated rhomboid family serine protease
VILPYYGGFPKIKKAPVTWSLLLLNALVMLAVYNFQLLSNFELEDFYKNEFFEVQGKLYAQIIDRYPKHYSEIHRQMAVRSLSGDRNRSIRLGQLALADENFNQIASSFQFHGDQVAVEYWKRNFANFVKLRAEHPNFLYGISSIHYDWYNWISYLFIHAGFMHLIGNMWFLLVVGAMVEKMLGSVAFLSFYLVTGATSAVFYFLLSTPSAIPLVGASGAISALVAFYSVVRWNKKVRFVTMFFMFRWEYLMVYLPAWVGLVYWVGLDLSGYLSQVDHIGGVAHAAHLGGVAIGVILGILFRWRKSLSHSVFRYNTGI